MGQKAINWHKLNIKSENTLTAIGSRVFLDDEEIHGVRSVRYGIGVDDPVPTAVIEMNILPEVEFMCRVQIEYTPKTIEEAKKIIAQDKRRVSMEDIYSNGYV